MDVPHLLRLAGFALGAFGGVLVFAEFFQLPSYVEYDEALRTYTLELSPSELREHSWVGRTGAFATALGFALLFVAELL
jgi:hypothetical protein